VAITIKELISYMVSHDVLKLVKSVAIWPKQRNDQLVLVRLTIEELNFQQKKLLKNYM
jgi:hypothetical protein